MGRQISIHGLVVGLLAAGVGCSFNTAGLSPPDTARVETGVRDGRPLEVGWRPDGPGSEQSTLLDGSNELPLHDLATPVDQKPKSDLPGPDLKPKPDLPKPDLKPKPDLPKPDLPKPDLPKPDLPPAPACASGGPVVTLQANMVICAGAASSQCDAGSACNLAGGWHLCKASEYLARGGKTAKPSGASWLASCIRSGSAPHAPTDAVCANCGISTVSMASVDWTCSQTTTTVTNAAHVGVVARSACNRVGTNSAQTEGAWSMSYSGTTRGQSVCCK